jgi:hypothetical protein
MSSKSSSSPQVNGYILDLNATLSGEPYHLPAEILEPCQADFVSRVAFLRFLSEQPGVYFRVVEMLITHVCLLEISQLWRRKPDIENLSDQLGLPIPFQLFIRICNAQHNAG